MLHHLISIYRRFYRWLGHQRWFAVMGRRVGAPLDRFFYELTGGRFAPSALASPMLLLTTTGRRSGLLRTTPVMYVKDGDRFVVTSENFGQERPAAWPLNLMADPAAQVQVGSRVIVCSARLLSDEEADSYWDRLLEIWPAHGTYRRRSGERHTFVLEPQAGVDARG